MSAISACEFNDFDKVKELIDKGELVLFNHVYFGNIEELSFLIEKGCNNNAKNKGRGTPLHYACIRNNFSVIKLLLEKGADIESKDIYGNTPLITSSIHSSIVIMKFLIGKGANIEEINYDSGTFMSYVRRCYRIHKGYSISKSHGEAL